MKKSKKDLLLEYDYTKFLFNASQNSFYHYLIAFMTQLAIVIAFMSYMNYVIDRTLFRFGSFVLIGLMSLSIFISVKIVSFGKRRNKLIKDVNIIYKQLKDRK